MTRLIWRLLKKMKPHAYDSRAAKKSAACISLGDGVGLCRVLARYKMYVPLKDKSLTPHLLLDGVWEVWVTNAIASRIEPGMVVADVGANSGYFSIVMADRVGSEGHVLSFEPNMELAPLVVDNAIVNGFSNRISVHQCALGDGTKTEAVLVIPGEYLGGGAIWKDADADTPNSQNVRIMRLDDLDQSNSISVIKIDAEGHEPMIWAGMRKTIEHGFLKTIFMEFTAAHYENPSDFIDQIIEAGFSLEIVDQTYGVIPITKEGLLSLPANSGPMIVLSR